MRADVYCDLRLKCTSIRALDGQRAVCAYARGSASETDSATIADIASRGQRVHFNPKRADTFTLDDGTPVHTADALAIDHKTAYVLNPR